MAASNEVETLRTLQRLLALCVDGGAGYRQAAAAVSEPAIHRLLAKNAAEREEVARAFASALTARGLQPSQSGSLAGLVHRRWLDAVAALRPDSMRAVLRECQRGEHETMLAFTAALGRSLPEDVRALVQSQLGRVFHASAALNRIAFDVEAQHVASTTS